MLADDIKKVEYYVDFGGPHNNIADAWSRIKTALEESQKTPTNKQSAPCFFCGVVGGKHKSSCHLRKVAENRDDW